jgi:hypothetical protein
MNTSASRGKISAKAVERVAVQLEGKARIRIVLSASIFSGGFDSEDETETDRAGGDQSLLDSEGIRRSVGDWQNFNGDGGRGD